MTIATSRADPLRVLLLEDVPDDAELNVAALRREGMNVENVRVETAGAFQEALTSFRPDIVLADYSLPSWDGMSALRLVRKERPDLPFVVVTGTINEETAVDCIKQGADDYILKERLGRLAHAARAAIDHRASIAARRRVEEELLVRNSALEAAANGVVITDPKGVIVWVNPAFTEMTGYSLEEAVGRTPRLLRSNVQSEAFYRNMWETITAGRAWQGELYNKRKDGRLYLEEMTITPVRRENGALTHFVAIKQDITERKRQDEAIRSLATRDLLTGLPNQAALREELKRVVDDTDRGWAGALLLLDVDRFALLNEAAGHPTGDRLLVVLAERVAIALPPQANLYRFGGDQFAVLLEGASLAEAEKVAEEIRATVESLRFEVDGNAFDITASAGVAPVLASKNPSAVLALADAALHAAKEAGRNRVVSFSEIPSGLRRMDEMSRWAVRVKDGLREGRCRLLAQRVVSLATGESDHAELLIRLVDEGGTLVSPAAFLPAAEKFGLMPSLDRWVVGQAITLLTADPARKFFVNLSGMSLGEVSLLDEIERLVVESRLPPGRLTFEITETAAIADMSGVQRWARRLKELGCFLALDDFGTGFSSFAYLQALPVDLVKIDGSFVRDLDTNATNQALVRAIVMVAHALGKSVVGEMVERAPVADILRSMGVEYGQGWLWGRPEPVGP